jgi:hypothetical protein
MKKLLARLAVLLAIGGSLVFAAQPASASTYLGGVSIWNACVYQHGTPSDVALVSNDVYGWRCHYNGGWNGIYMGVSVGQECKRTHGSSAYAEYADFNNPYSWGCYV